MKKILSLAAVAACLLFAGVASAGTVYLPLAVNQTIEGNQYRSLLWATNTGDEPAQIKLRFIPNETDGTTNVEGPFHHVATIEPGATIPMTAAYGKVGMLEVTTPSRVHFISELHTFSAGGQRLSSTSVPLIDALNLVPSAETIHLLALERQQGASLSNLGLVNLHDEETECTVRAFRPEGDQIQGTVRLNVPALGQRVFTGALGILGITSIDGARFEVSCEDPFYAFGMVASRFPDSTQFVTPAAGGNQVLAETSLPGSTVGVNKPGQFFFARSGDSVMEVPIPAPAGEFYSRAVVEFDVRTGPIYPVFTATVGFIRPNPGRALYFGHFVRGLNKHGVVNKTILDVDHEVSYQGSNGVWEPNTNFRVKFDYDAVAGRINLTVKKGNKVVESLSGGVSNLDLGHTGQGLKLVFGLQSFTAEAYYPPTNWRFSNLKVNLTP